MKTGLNYSKEDLLRNSQAISVNALKNFFDFLGLNPDDFEHLYNIPINLDEEKDAGRCYIDDNIISLNGNDIDYYLGLIHESNEEPSIIEKIELNLSALITHEIIHMNRKKFLK